MRNRAVRRLRGPLVVTPDHLAAIFELAENARPRAESLWLDEPPIIKVNYSDDESYTVHAVSEVLALKNRRRSFISSIRVSWPYGSQNVSIDIGGRWWKSIGAEMEIEAPPEKVREAVERFEGMFDDSKDLFLMIASLPNIVLTLAMIALIHFGLGWFSQESMALVKSEQSKNIFLIPNYILLLWAMPAMILEIAVLTLKSRFLGNAIFFWAGGISRFKTRRTVLIFLGATLPISALTARNFG